MNAACCAKLHQAAQDRRCSGCHFASPDHDRFIERLALPSIGFADEYAQELALFRNLHNPSTSSSSGYISWAIRPPAPTAASPSNTLPDALSAPLHISPSRSSS